MNDAWTLVGLEYVARLIVRLADKRMVQAEAWNDVYVLPYVRRITATPEGAQAATDAVRAEYVKLDTERFGQPEDDDADIEGEQLCKTVFSLAYGGLLLLNHTMLRLHRGHRYGIVAANGSGKSTLLKAMRDGKVEGYPPPEEVRTVMVEHSLQGEDGSKPILDFVAEDKQLAHKTREQVAEALHSVGFDDERQSNPVGSLSGGWKMKLELARAMLIGADILLLDEPTNHLDVASIAWLEQYLVNNKDITVLTVSHDSSFLDNVCTDIIHYEHKKLKYYRGNLSAFVSKRPEAKSYYSLAATSVKFSFPPPGSLMGVRSNTRTILKASHVTVQYPGMSRPSLVDASVSISLSSRVGVIGPNGVGKSTLFKTIVGFEEPDSGSVEVGDTVQISYVDQNRENIDPEQTVWEVVSDGLDYIHVGQNEMPSRAYLSAFGFKGPDQQKPSKVLSGGERNRLNLALTLKQGGNLILLDEPTNDLDVETLGSLENALQKFPGCAVVISHDRWFLDRTCTHILAWEGNIEEGKWFWFEGNFGDYEANKVERLGEEAAKPSRVTHRKLTR